MRNIVKVLLMLTIYHFSDQVNFGFFCIIHKSLWNFISPGNSQLGV